MGRADKISGWSQWLGAVASDHLWLVAGDKIRREAEE